MSCRAEPLTAALKKLLTTLCGLLAALALFAIMLLTFADVMGRKFLDASVTGSLELTELLMVVVIFAGLPLVSLQGEHVVFDSLDRWVPATLRRLQQAAVDLLVLALPLGLAWLIWGQGRQHAQLRRHHGAVEAAAGAVCLPDEPALHANGWSARDAGLAARRAPSR